MIRAATPSDVAAVVAIEQRCFGPRAWSTETVSAEIGGDTRVVLGWEDDDGLRGYVSSSVVADTADLLRIAVLPQERRHGVGRELLAAVISDVRARGAERMMLEVAEDNASALALYREAGCVEISRRRGYYGPEVDAVVMELAPLPGRATLEP